MTKQDCFQTQNALSLHTSQAMIQSKDFTLWAQEAYHRLEQSDVILVLGELWFDVYNLLMQTHMSALQDSKHLPPQFMSESKHIIALHPIADMRFAEAGYFPRYTQFQYEIGTEIGVALLLLKYLAQLAQRLPSAIATFLEELDIGYIASESALAEEEVAVIAAALSRAKTPLILFGSSFLAHKEYAILSKILLALRYSSALMYLPIYYEGAPMTFGAHIDSDSLNQSSLDSSDLLRLQEIVENLPENNGAMIYLNMLPTAESSLADKATKQDIQVPMPLYVSEPFLYATKLQPNEVVMLILEGYTLACILHKVQYFNGVVGVLQACANLEAKKIWRYPFIRAQFCQNKGA